MCLKDFLVLDNAVRKVDLPECGPVCRHLVKSNWSWLMQTYYKRVFAELTDGVQCPNLVSTKNMNYLTTSGLCHITITTPVNKKRMKNGKSQTGRKQSSRTKFTKGRSQYYGRPRLAFLLCGVVVAEVPCLCQCRERPCCRIYILKKSGVLLSTCMDNCKLASQHNSDITFQLPKSIRKNLPVTGLCHFPIATSYRFITQRTLGYYL